MQAVIFCGIQGAGKSTFYRHRFFDTHIRINLDMLRTRHRETLMLRACIEAKQPFVVDNTNPTIQERARYISAARAARFAVIGYYFDSSIEEARRRNEQRPEKQRIPLVGILGCRKRLVVPSYAEGFDVLYHVRIGEGGEFIVEQWPRPIPEGPDAHDSGSTHP